MYENKIAEIVIRVFDKAKLECASHSKHALSNHISDRINLSYRTLERAYDKYINHKAQVKSPQNETIEMFCDYLGYEGYGDYIRKNPFAENEIQDEVKNSDLNEEGKNPLRRPIFFAMAIGVALLIIGVLNFSRNHETTSGEEKCMTWADSLYVVASCSTKPYSKFGTEVVPFDEVRLKNFKKIQVSQSTNFLTEDDKPLVWYYKNKEGQIEYFTAPGLHPTNGETLKKITPYIIQTYVPLHSDKEDSFVE